jgi:hypothetical protein
MNFTGIANKIVESDPLDFGSIFSKSIELFKKVWVQGFVIVLLTIVIMIPFYILMYIPLIITGVTDPEMLSTEEIPPEVIIPMAIIMPIVFLGIMVVSLMLNAAFLRICKIKDLNLLESDNYFHYFKKEYVSKTVILALMALGLMLLGVLACGIGVFYMVVPISLFPAFLAFDKELSAKEILKSSFSLGNKNWLVIFGLIIVMGIIAELGVLLCFVGVLFTAMLAKIPVYFMYKDSIGFYPAT